MKKHNVWIWPWPTPLTYNPSLAKVKVNPIPKMKVIGQMIQTGEHTQTNGSYQVHNLPASLKLRSR